TSIALSSLWRSSQLSFVSCMRRMMTLRGPQFAAISGKGCAPSTPLGISAPSPPSGRYSWPDRRRLLYDFLAGEVFSLLTAVPRDASALLLFVREDGWLQPSLHRFHDCSVSLVSRSAIDQCRFGLDHIKVPLIVAVTTTTGNRADVAMRLPGRPVDGACDHLQVRVSITAWMRPRHLDLLSE